LNFITKLCPVPSPLKPEQFLGHLEWSIERKAGHLASRLALAQAYREFHLLCPPSQRAGTEAAQSQSNIDWYRLHESELEEQDFHQLKRQNDLLCSRSHTKFLSAGAIAAFGLGLYSIGIDLEAMNRPIKSQVEKFFLNDNEPELFGDSNLSLWVVKEACFKAISSFYLSTEGKLEPSLTLKSIELKALSPTEGEFSWAQIYKGHFKLILLRPHDLGDYLLAEASLTQVP
jgi:phosphopantetheinyl transferase (holo-ACP synthase)